MKRQSFVVLNVIICLMLGVIGCSHRTLEVTPEMTQHVNIQAQPPIEVFEYDRTPIPIRMKFQEETDKYSIYLVKFDVKDFPELKNRYARVFYFVQKKRRENSPCLIVLPPTGGGMDIPKRFAEYFAEQGFTTLAFYRRERFFNPEKTLEYNEHLFRQSVIDVRRAIDFLYTQPEVDTNKLGIMGASLGGIISSLATAADSRIKATAMLISGGNLPKILDRSNYSRIARFRDGLIRQYNISRSEISEFTEPYLKPIDPITYAKRIDPSKMLMINGYLDTIIPLSAARDTWVAFGKPEWRILLVSHYSSMLMVRYAQEKIFQHYQKVLDIPAAEDE